ncbi:MAG: 4Fe-4S binding protein [Sedimentisphaerales bacterium]|nr:4Fe-4S binding protein [Sedimentisphaerales bacterium]
MNPVSPTQVQERVILNLDRCIGCRSCSAACYYGHDGMPNVAFGVIEEGTLPLICRQCSEPPCVEVCPVGALRQEENGVVTRSRMLCVGCLNCVYACPFGSISPQLTLRQVAKCDMCEDLLARGAIPRCVQACPAGALQYRRADELGENDPLLLSGRIVGRSPYKRR